MKIIIDRDIPFISDYIPESIEAVYLSGKDISPSDVKDADALVVRTRTLCNRCLLEGSKVKLIATATIGTDHIDIPWCVSNGIEVRSAPGCNAPGVAQYVFASLFQAGFHPETDVLGIIGHGHVGSLVNEWALLMGIRTLVSDAPKKAEGMTDIDYREKEEILRNSNAVSLHVPLTHEGDFPTYRLIGEKEIAMMKTGSLLVNTSRGGVVDEEALKENLQAGRIRAIVDVWENEPDVDTSLLDLVETGTPHIAGYSAEGKKRATRMVLEALSEVLDIPTDMTGLECPYPESAAITPERILATYDPRLDTRSLRCEPSSFESLRNNYSYRPEPRV